MTKLSPRYACAQSAVARYLRRWPCLPHVWVTATSHGHQVIWRDPDAPWNMEVLETRGIPGKSSFHVLDKPDNVPGRVFRYADQHVLHTNEIDICLYPHTGQPWIHTLSSEDAHHGIRVLNRVLLRTPSHDMLPHLVAAQGLSEHSMLSVLWDSLMLSDAPSMYGRIAIQHAREKGRAMAWSFGHTLEPWGGMTLIAWEGQLEQHCVIVPHHKPVMYAHQLWRLDTPALPGQSAVPLHLASVSLAQSDFYGRDLLAWQDWANAREDVSTDWAWGVPLARYIDDITQGDQSWNVNDSMYVLRWQHALAHYLHEQVQTPEQERLRAVLTLDAAFERDLHEQALPRLRRWCNEMRASNPLEPAWDLGGLNI